MDVGTKGLRNLGEEGPFCTLTFRAEFFVPMGFSPAFEKSKGYR